MTANTGFHITDDQATTDALFKGIADSVPGLLYIIDLREMKMIYANRKVLELFGRTLSELAALGRSLFDVVVYPPDRAVFDSHINELLSAPVGHVAELSFRVLNAMNEPIWLRTRLTIFQWDGCEKPTHVISVSQDISKEVELQQANERLAHERQQIKDEKELEAVRNVFASHEEERDNIAESLHNGLGQLLYGIKLSVSSLERDSAKDFVTKKQYIIDLLEDGIRQARKISHQLLPVILNDFGLKAAIVDFYEKMNSPIIYSLQLIEENKKAPQYIDLAIFRIVQQLVYNVQEHANATICHIQIHITARHADITVSDNSSKASSVEDPLEVPRLRLVRDRVSLLRGTIQYEREDLVNRIKVSLPYIPDSQDVRPI